MPDDLDDGQTDGGNPMRDLREHAKRLEQDAKQARTEAEQWKAGAQQADALLKENVFLKAGVDPDASPVAKLLFAAYDGDLTADAVKARAAELGITPGQASAAATQQQTIESQVAALDRGSIGSVGRDPGQDAEFDAAIAAHTARGGTQQELKQLLIRYGRLATD